MSFAQYQLLMKQLNETKPGDRVQFYDQLTGQTLSGTVERVTQVKRKTMSTTVAADDGSSQFVDFGNYLGPADA